jgi:hypothetical protein
VIGIRLRDGLIGDFQSRPSLAEVKPNLYYCVPSSHTPTSDIIRLYSPHLTAFLYFLYTLWS